MAGITGLAVVGIPAHTSMLIIHIVFTVFMTVDTGKFPVIGSQMTIAARDVPVVPGKDRELMTKYCLVPGHVGAVMAGVARGRKTGRLVIGCPGGVVILFMASVAIPGKVVSRGMAYIASQGFMGALQAPIQVVIKSRPGPG